MVVACLYTVKGHFNKTLNHFGDKDNAHNNSSKEQKYSFYLIYFNFLPLHIVQ